ncbi:hypothetical protein Q4519_06635 [Motilimonas sp. 1_MG-2023]|uniref:hypothetical protein n=1 Tax=Motilimonas sp. 1_MG-2023 TaxID=3062672 RepID=UPI0026E221F3|nr:hypothetical protein [Motilimonas sp. 1_MG-2023]MDO6525359.1 hypothetical protein [Motilimonas sp. 1_MG-2023]
MKQASRFMPQYEPEKTSRGALIGYVTVALTIILVMVVVVVYQPWSLVVFVGLAIFAKIVWVIDQPKVEQHFLKLCQERDGLSICEFAKSFDTNVVDTWVIRAVYEQLQAALPTEHKVPIKASDSLLDTLLLDMDDIDLSLVEEIAQRTGRSLELFEKNPYIGKVTTAQNLVLFFNHQAPVHAMK